MLTDVQDGDIPAARYSIILLSLVSGLIHLHLAFLVGIGSLLGISFGLAALGFATAILLILQGSFRNLAYLGLVISTAAQIVLWYRMNLPDLVHMILEQEPLLDFVDKTAQLLIILLSIYLLQRNGYDSIEQELKLLLESAPGR